MGGGDQEGGAIGWCWCFDFCCRAPVAEVEPETGVGCGEGASGMVGCVGVEGSGYSSQTSRSDSAMERDGTRFLFLLVCLFGRSFGGGALDFRRESRFAEGLLSEEGL